MMKKEIILIMFVLFGITLAGKSGLYDLISEYDRPSISIPSFPSLSNLVPIGMIISII
jgi:hypothetical protein